MTQTPALKPRNTPPFVAFMKEGASSDAARAVAASNGWSEGCVHYGDVRQAVVYLKEQPSPKILLVEIPSSQEAPELLDRLADVCSQNMRVIVAGSINEFSFYSWLKDIGIEHYLLQPFTAEMLRKLIQLPDPKAVAAGESQNNCTLIACMGARGGVGTTTVTANLAHILAKEYKQQTALLDMDAYFGTVAMAFNLQPSHGLRDALDKPDRIDGLFLDRVMLNQSPHLAILSAEEALRDTLASSASAAESLIAELRQKYSYVLIDLPRMLTPLTRSILAQADKTILVSDLSLLSLRDLLRLRDYIVEDLHRPDPVVVVNREGIAGKHELKRDAFSKHYGRAIEHYLPFMTEAFAATSAGEMLIDVARKNPAVLEALRKLAETFSKGGEIPEPEKQSKIKALAGKLRGIK